MGFGGFLKALSQSGFTSHFRSGWYLGFSPSELLLASPCFRQNPKYQPRYYDRFRERLQETPKPHGSRTYWELTIFSRLTGFTGDTEDWSFFPCSIAPLEIRKPLSKSASVHGFKGQGFKPALVRRDVAMKLLSHSMGLAFHHHILTCQVWARVPLSSQDRIWGAYLREKRQAWSCLIQNLEPNWQLLGKMNIFNEDFGSSIPSLSLTRNVEPWTCERLPKGLQQIYNINEQMSWQKTQSPLHQTQFLCPCLIFLAFQPLLDPTLLIYTLPGLRLQRQLFLENQQGLFMARLLTCQKRWLCVKELSPTGWVKNLRLAQKQLRRFGARIWVTFGCVDWAKAQK